MDEQTPVVQTPETRPKRTFRERFHELRAKKMFPLAVLIAMLAVLFGAAGISFALYQQPTNVLDSALQNAISSKHVSFKGTVVAQASTPVTVDFDGAATQKRFSVSLTVDTGSTAAPQRISGAIIYDSTGTIYVRLSGIKGALSKSGTDSAQLQQAYDQIAAKIEGIWFKLTPEDLGRLTGESGNVLTCYQKLSDAISSGSEQGKLGDLYQKHHFIVIDKTLPDEMVNGMNSFHYQLRTDKVQAKQFADGLKQLDSFKKFETCSGNQDTTDTMTDQSSTAKDEQLQVWIDKWSHALTRFKQTSVTQDGAKASLDVTFDFGKSVTITLPTKTTDIKDLMTQFQAAS